MSRYIIILVYFVMFFGEMLKKKAPRVHTYSVRGGRIFLRGRRFVLRGIKNAPHAQVSFLSFGAGGALYMIGGGKYGGRYRGSKCLGKGSKCLGKGSKCLSKSV
jgi:hypothetical protein